MLGGWGRSCDLCWQSWADLGPLWCSWAALGAFVAWASTGGPGVLLGPLCVVLVRSWIMCWRSRAALGTLFWQSWAALGAYVGGLVPKNVKTWLPEKYAYF